ncbi:hypothetical protein DFH08DRAFT_816234 [Mycena albidolilacea]|uniref:Uncharacterized protein n=1 Tax=Mycena albidolilacea TaxID=1033008 RepID=A0AAD7EII0_9AGAR|nr:hypothetical protein DFH08DRAFT_816234 [Mycena albidolilacea]
MYPFYRRSAWGIVFDGCFRGKRMHRWTLGQPSSSGHIIMRPSPRNIFNCWAFFGLSAILTYFPPPARHHPLGRHRCHSPPGDLRSDPWAASNALPPDKTVQALFGLKPPPVAPENGQ